MTTNAPTTQPKPNARAINQPGNGIGKRRQGLYKHAHERIKAALDAGFYLEAITLCESILADRLEARRAWLNQQDHAKRQFSTLGGLVRELTQSKAQDMSERDEGAQAVYREIGAWARSRNHALHEMAKLAEGDDTTWDERYKNLAKIAATGHGLTRKVSTVVRKLNKA